MILINLIIFILPIFYYCHGNPITFLGQTPFQCYIPSSQDIGLFLYQLYAVESSSLEPVSVEYSIVSGNDLGLFVINSTNGIIHSAFPLGVSDHTLAIQADSSGNTTTASLSIHIIPSLHQSLFEHTRYNLSIAEDIRVGTRISIIRVFSSVQATVSLGGDSQGDFMLNPLNGHLSVARPLDREAIPVYHINLLVQDGSDSQDNVAILVVMVTDVNDETPVFHRSFYNVTVDDGTLPNSTVAMVMAMDRDEGSNGRLVYSLSGDANVMASFYVHATTGIVYNSITLDYEVRRQHQFTITATDQGDMPRSSYASVLVTLRNLDDTCPQFSSSLYEIEQTSTELEILNVPRRLLWVEAFDPDNISRVEYAIQSGNDENVFQINSTIGVITLLRSDIRGQFELNVSASDGCFTFTMVTVSLGDVVNEHHPEFISSCQAELRENATIGTHVITVVAIDDDTGRFGRLTYSFLTETSLFAINESSGEIVTTAIPESYDRESVPGFELGVLATDGGGLQGFCEMWISLIDINDNPPLFIVTAYSVSIRPSFSIGQFVVQVQANDRDTGIHGNISYSIDDPVPFAIDANGIITVSQMLISQNYSFHVFARNQGTPLLSSSVPVMITMPTGEIPVFTGCTYNISMGTDQICVYSVTIPESIRDDIGIIVATNVSRDSTVVVVYEALRGRDYRSNGERTLYVASSGSIQVNTSSVLDYERLSPGPYVMQFLVSAHVLPNHTFAVAMVIINVTDVDDSPPRFPAVTLFATVTENVGINARVTMATAHDPDSGLFGRVTHSIRGEQTDFAISPSNGIVTSLRSFDAEMESDFTLIVRAVSNGKEDFASLVISVGDINDNAPFFSQSVYNISVRENEPVFSKLFHFPITDLDQSDRGRHIYSIVGGNNDGTFSITRSGDLILQQLLDYDRSSRRSYFLSVHVSDGMFSDEAYVNIQIIDVDDEPPIFTPDTYSVVLSEAVAEGTFVVQLIAVDIDSDTITYRLTGLADGRLAVTTNGTVLVSGELDREFLPQLWFFAFAIGEEGCIAVATVTITLTDVNDNAPIWLHPFIVAVIQENVAGPTLITTVLATDPDEGHSGTVTYHLMDNFDRFLINATSGELTAIVAFDREQIQLLSVMVTARDNGTPQLSSQVEVLIEILDVNDNPPFFPYPYMFARVCEDAPVGQNVLFIPAADRDTGSNAAVQFILESGGTDDGRFKVNISTGEVTLAQRIDFENITHHLATLHISLVDLGIPTHRSVSMATLEIELLDSNDNQPIPSESSHVVSLAEDIPIGRVVLTLTSTDRDSGSNAELTYSITCCIDSVFSVITEGNNGLLTVASTLDYETISVHQLEIVVSDNGRPPLHSSISVSINVSDVNDNPPQFSQSVYSVSVPENITSVVELIQVSASDPDTGLGGVIDTYAILTGNEEGYFTINEATGFVGLQGAEFDRETVDQYVLTVTATDQGNPQQLTGSALLLVTISDVDDNPSYSGYMTIFINSLDGRFQAGYLGDVYLNDSDSSSILERCVGTSGDQDLLGVADNCSLILQEDDPGEGLYELIVNGTSGDVSVTTTVMVTVKHIATPSSFLALTLGVNVETYLLSHYTSFPILLAELVGVSKVDIISITPSDGEESVDIVFTGETLPPVSHIIQQLFLQRDIFTANDIPLVTIPIDVCQDNYCLNLGRCISRSTVTNGRVPTVMSTFVYYSVHVIYKRSCDCGYWATGNRCETVFDHCYSNPCNNGGVCKNVILDFECDCPDSTTGKQCNDDCSNRECLNGGVCVSDLAASSYCSCPEGYYGDKCQYQYFVDSNYCIPSPCQNGATCSAGRDGFTCHCPRGYSGSLCEQSVVREGGCVSNPCYHNSTCIVNATNGFVCACSVGFTGPQCRWPLNECETKPCGSDVNACLPGRYGSYLCRCGHGYTGPNCSLPDFCDPNPCRNGGTCDLVADGYRCQCNANYIGMNCEDLIADCMDNMCMHNSSCRDNGLTCDCPLFAAGRYCEVFCPHGNTGEMCEQEINFCQSNSSICLNGGTCLNTKAGATCDCPPTQFGDRCEMNCSDENCANDGTCTSDLGVCQCDDGFDGPQCKLTTISFRASPGQPTYRAYDTLQFRTLGVISFQVATRASHGLLLLSIRWDGSELRDFISVELVQGGHVSAKMSLGGGTAVTMVMSNVVQLNNGRWHNVMLKIKSKELQLLVDHCIDVDSMLLPLLDCHSTAVASGNYSSLDLGLPLWIGGAPEIEGLSEGTGINSCISNFTINNQLLDLEDYVDELNSARGCEQLDGCRVNRCVEGVCAVEWKGHQCYVTEPVTFTGDGYARYTLLDSVLDSGIAKRQVTMEMAFYEESISMRVQTNAEEGLLFQMSGANDFAVLELQDGHVSYSIDIGSGVAMVTGDYISDAVWHTIEVRRVGLSVTMMIDDTNIYSTSLQGNSIIFDILTNEIYAGGHDQAVLYNGCIDDIRLIDKQLPTNGTNQFASVTFIGTSPRSGCVISGPCLSNPCMEGVCQPISEDTYRCVCSDGACPLTVSENTDDPLVLYIGIVVGALLILTATTIATFLCIYCRHRQQHYGRYILPSKEHHEMYFVEENMATIGDGQEDGGGEEDTDCKGIVIHNQGIQPSTPEIKAIIMSCKPEADKELTEVDSLRHFAYEGSDQGEGSLSTLCSSDGHLLEQLAQMGPKFDDAKQLLERLEVEQEDSDDSDPT